MKPLLNAYRIIVFGQRKFLTGKTKKINCFLFIKKYSLDKHLHIVCFDIPLPADYGGVIDVFCRIKALHEVGIQIHLHCFEYGRPRQQELIKYCAEVNYYRRFTGWKGFSFRLPYIVNSRRNKSLLQKLCMDDHPVLLEGIHCTYFLSTHQLNNRKVFVRIQNIEHEYYYNLISSGTSFFKKIYYQNESRLLKIYEKKIGDKALFLGISQGDIKKANKIWGAVNNRYLPAFIPYQQVTARIGMGEYCIYHGNLAVAENERAAIWLSENVFNEINIPLIIAGKAPSAKLQNAVKHCKNCSLMPDLPDEKLNELISNAQVNILPSFNSTGIKLKLLNVLFNGRHCIVNKATVDGTGFDVLCCVAETKEEFRSAIQRLFNEPFAENEIEKRAQLLNKEYNNKTNGERLMQWIY